MYDFCCVANILYFEKIFCSLKQDIRTLNLYVVKLIVQNILIPQTRRWLKMINFYQK